VLELCVGFSEVADLRAVVCRLVTEPSSVDGNGHAVLLKNIAHWAVLSPTELTVAVECLQHICEVTSFLCELFYALFAVVISVWLDRGMQETAMMFA